MPTVALVLGSGGARGNAHIGVIQVLEEQGFDIISVSGCSMGAVVGGFYAAGYTIEEMEEIVYSEEFQNWVAGQISDNYRYFLYKEEDNASMLSLKLALDSLLNVSLKSTLVKDHSINFALAEKLARASARANCNFDSLMVPFRSLAAEIFNQDIVVQDNGNLNEVIRASLNVPFFFKPVKVNGKYLFDGGLYDNFPVNLAKKEFNPDVIIGVNVSSKNYTEYPFDEDDDLIGNPLLYLLLSKSDSSQIDSSGIYIEPVLTNYSALDFSKADTLLKLGYEATLKKINLIRQKVNRTTPKEAMRIKREIFRASLPHFRLGDIYISGLRPSPKKYLKSMFHYRPKNLNLENLKKKYFRLAEADKFELLYPNFSYNPLKEVFDFEIRAKSDPSIKADIGGNLSSRSISQLYLGIDYDYVRNLLYSFKLNFYSGQFYLSTSFKTKINIPTKTPIYIQPYFVFNRWN